MSKDKKNSFLELEPDNTFNEKVLKSAQVELRLNRQMHRNKKILVYIAPFLAAVAAVFIFVKSNQAIMENEFNINDDLQMALTTELVEDADSLDLVEDLNMLEDLEYLSDFENGGDNV